MFQYVKEQLIQYMCLVQMVRPSSLFLESKSADKFVHASWKDRYRVDVLASGILIIVDFLLKNRTGGLFLLVEDPPPGGILDL
jgi:hypothetical protein